MTRISLAEYQNSRRIMAGASSLTAEHTMRNVERSGRLKLVRQGGTVAERYQGGVAHRSAEAAASWWHLLSEDAVSEARAAARRTARWIKSASSVRAGETVSRPYLRAKRSRSVRAVHAALSSSGGTVAPWQFLFEVDDV